MFVIHPNKINARSDDISLMSYNILLPNSEQGWWVYKYYHPNTPREERTWESRKKLFKKQISLEIDLFTFQECAFKTYEMDLELFVR